MQGGYRVLYSNAGGYRSTIQQCRGDIEYYTAMQGGYSSIGVLYSNAGGI